MSIVSVRVVNQWNRRRTIDLQSERITNEIQRALDSGSVRFGLAIGDSLGAHFEGQTAEHIARRYRTVEQLIKDRPHGELWYTDDTQMAIGVAETLVECKRIDDVEICRRFAENYQPQRGYGRGARVVVEAMLERKDHKYLAANHFPGGSFGIGQRCELLPSA